MGIITPNVTTKITTFHQLLSLAFIGIFAVASPATKADVNITATASSKVVAQDIESEEVGNASLTTLLIDPNVSVSYQSPILAGFWQGKLTHLERDSDDASREDTFAEYNYSAVWRPFSNLLSIQVAGALNYQNAQAGNFLVSDFVSNSSSLAKTRSNRLTLASSIEQGDWLRGAGQVSYSDVASERTARNNGFALNNDTYQLSGTLKNGDRARTLIWEVSGSFQNTDRAQNNQGAFVSRNASGFADIRIVSNWALRVTGTHEGNQISSRNDTTSLVRKFNTYGVGVTYRPNQNRFISVTANTTSSDLTDDDEESFLGFDMQWALSPRTSIGATYGRRFFGETASANIAYNSKYFRTSFGYSEDITNTSRLLANPENLGVFVCPAISSSIANCFQPNSLNYVPNADEQFVQITTQNLEFNDDIIIRKGSNFQMGYDFSRLTVGASWRYSENSALDRDRLIRTYSLGSSLAYQLGSYTTINANINYANVVQRSLLSESADGGESENWNSSVGVERTIGESLIITADIQYLDKSGDLTNGGGVGNGLFGANFTDRRITVGVSYTYD